jgi:hypothetical protein
MTWVVWRQHRNQAYFAAAVLAAFAVLLLVTGQQMASQYQSALASCAASRTCGNLASALTLGSPVVSLLVTLTVVVPCLLGVFWGGPLVARELETGTSQFTWMQSVSRRRWLAVKAGWVLLAAAAWGGAVSALVTWWSSPVNALKHQNFQPSQFDIQGIVPVGYAVFAVALGIATGALLRRTLPALAITLGFFVFLRIVVADYLRPHYMTAITTAYNLLHPVTPGGSYWQLASGTLGPDGKVQSFLGIGSAHLELRQQFSTHLNQVIIDRVPPACSAYLHQASSIPAVACLTRHGYRGFLSYQPASRYWAFQGIETGIFVFLAAALLAVTAIAVLHRDA